jgi:hypothetical protein
VRPATSALLAQQALKEFRASPDQRDRRVLQAIQERPAPQARPGPQARPARPARKEFKASLGRPARRVTSEQLEPPAQLARLAHKEFRA